MNVLNKPCNYLIFLLFISNNLYAQFLNKDVKAIIDFKVKENTIGIKAKAENLLKYSQSLQYELIVYVEDDNGNKSKNSQSDRFVLEPSKIVDVGSVAVRFRNKNAKTIIVLLIKDVDEKTIASERKVFLGSDLQQGDYDKKITLHKTPIKYTLKNDGVVLKGVVLERTKTKSGRDFYRLFYTEFTKYNFKDKRPILIEELHFRGRNTKIFVKIDNKTIYEFFAQPKTDYLKLHSSMAIKSLYDFFEKKEKDYIVRY